MLAALLSGAVSGAAAAAAPLLDRFEQLRVQDLRVTSVAYRLAVANAPRCASVATPQLGFVLHGLGQYSSIDRESAVRRFGLGEHVGVMAVVVGSPAETTGMVAGDQLLAVDGHRLDEPSTGSEPGGYTVERVRSALVEAMRHGAVTLSVSSSSGVRDLRFAAKLGCPSNVELVTGEDVNAWADGSRVMIGEGLLRRCATDDELALVIGHEMAHNLLHHRRRLAAEGISVNGLLPLTATASSEVRATEEEADRFAVTLATTAHFDLSGAASFIGELSSRGAPPAATHPDLSRRVRLLRAAIADTAHASEPAVVSE